MPEMVRWLFWFHIRASVVMWPSAASRICSLVHSMCSFSIVTSNQLSSYQPERVQYSQYSKICTIPNYSCICKFVYGLQNSCYKLWDIVYWVKKNKTFHSYFQDLGLQGMVFHISVLLFFTLKMHKSLLQKGTLLIKFSIKM